MGYKVNRKIRMQAPYRQISAFFALAILAATAAPAWAQDGAEPSFESQFAQKINDAAQSAATVADPMAAAAADDEIITNLPDATAAPVSDAAAVEPPAMPAIASPEIGSPDDMGDDAAVDADTDTDADADVATTPAAQPATAADTAIETGAAAPAAEDPLAKLRAQQQILEAQQRAANQRPGTPVNPLGPAATLPVGGAPNQMTPEEMQLQMEAEAAEQAEKMKQQIFDTSIESLLPLTPQQTRDVLESFKVSREAAETPITVPSAKTTVENVSLDPSAPPLTIKTSPGYVTTVTILDMTGAPWAIQDISWAGKFEITTPEEGGHVIRITPMSAHGVGNISIRLVDLITPITFSIATGLDTVDYRFDARIPKPGPLAKTPLMEYGGLRTVAGSDENLMRVLDGTAVPAAERLTMDGVDGGTSAYRIDGVIYLRTPLTLLSPAWQTSATSADGMNVYTLKSTPVILLSDRGRMVKAKVKTAEQ